MKKKRKVKYNISSDAYDIGSSYAEIDYNLATFKPTIFKSMIAALDKYKGNEVCPMFRMNGEKRVFYVVVKKPSYINTLKHIYSYLMENEMYEEVGKVTNLIAYLKDS